MTLDPNRDAHNAYGKPEPRLPSPARPIPEPVVWPWIKAHRFHIFSMIGALAIVALFWVGLSAMSALEAEQDRAREAWKRDPANPVNVCIAKGGVPITSVWDGRLERCDFPGADR